MILSRHFVFIHFPKTGGTFVRRVVGELAPESWQIAILEDHPTVHDIPAAYARRPRFGFVRNPWDWYVSWYHYLRQRGDNEFFNRISANGSREFKETIRAAFETDFVRASGRGGYSWYVRHTFGEDLRGLRIGRFERLRTDLLAILEEIVPLSSSLRRAILEFPQVNVGRREAYREYYDEEMRALVARKDAELIETLEYRF